MAQISIASDLYLRLQEFAQHMQRPVDDVIQEILSAAISSTSQSADLLQALDHISGSLELPDSEERIRNHDRYFARMGDEDAP